MLNPNPMHGYYSETQAIQFGYYHYENTENEIVCVSEVCISGGPSGSYDDYIYAGDVVKYLKSFRGANLNSMIINFENYKFNYFEHKNKVTSWFPSNNTMCGE